jgi:hypothetical protein
MKVRCPAHEGLIEVAEDLAGGRIRCPECSEIVFVEPASEETPSSQIQASTPKGMKPSPSEPANLERQIYDGLPPLSVMMALRRGRGASGDADFDIRQQMTPDDWKALSAFESVLATVVALKMSFIYGVIAFIGNVFVWLADAYEMPTWPESPHYRLLGRIAGFVILGFGLFLLLEGRDRLSALRLGPVISLLPWCTLTVGMVFALNAVLNLLLWFTSRYPSSSLIGCVILSVPFNLIAAVDLGRVSSQLVGSLRKVRPPEILRRLTDALEYLK